MCSYWLVEWWKSKYSFLVCVCVVSSPYHYIIFRQYPFHRTNPYITVSVTSRYVRKIQLLSNVNTTDTFFFRVFYFVCVCCALLSAAAVCGFFYSFTSCVTCVCMCFIFRVLTFLFFLSHALYFYFFLIAPCHFRSTTWYSVQFVQSQLNAGIPNSFVLWRNS